MGRALGRKGLADCQRGNTLGCWRASRIQAFLRPTLRRGLAWIARPIGVILSGRPRPEDVVAAYYEGRAWRDLTERELINDIGNWPYKR